MLVSIEKFHATSPGGVVRLRFLGTNSEQGTCPAVYETDRGTFAVQGTLIRDPEALADCSFLPASRTTTPGTGRGWTGSAVIGRSGSAGSVSGS
jgi:hypothetical protein